MSRKTSEVFELLNDFQRLKWQLLLIRGSNSLNELVSNLTTISKNETFIKAFNNDLKKDIQATLTQYKDLELNNPWKTKPLTIQENRFATLAASEDVKKYKNQLEERIISLYPGDTKSPEECFEILEYTARSSFWNFILSIGKPNSYEYAVALNIAAEGNDTKAVILLLNNGACPQAAAWIGRSRHPLVSAAINQNLTMVEVLLSQDKTISPAVIEWALTSNPKFEIQKLLKDHLKEMATLKTPQKTEETLAALKMKLASIQAEEQSVIKEIEAIENIQKQSVPSTGTNERNSNYSVRLLGSPKDVAQNTIPTTETTVQPPL